MPNYDPAQPKREIDFVIAAWGWLALSEEGQRILGRMVRDNFTFWGQAVQQAVSAAHGASVEYVSLLHSTLANQNLTKSFIIRARDRSTF